MDDLALLVRLMEDDPSADVRATAGYGVLRIGRRVPRHLVALDWVVIAAYVVGMLADRLVLFPPNHDDGGLSAGRAEHEAAHVGLSLFATLMSTITYLAWPGEMIQYGPMMQCMIFAYPFVFLAAGYFMIPFIMKLRITSAYELLETRFGLSVRMLGSTFFLAMRFLWMAVIIFATTDTVLVPLMGLDRSATP